MLTTTLLVFGSVLLVLVLLDQILARLPLTPALVYLVVGGVAGSLLGAPSLSYLVAHAAWFSAATELVVLGSLFAVGLRLRMPVAWHSWRVAMQLAGPGVLMSIALACLLGAYLLQLTWPEALLVAAVLAPTDPVLASEVQIQSDQDRDAVRLSLTAEGGLNDGSAFPAVMLALGLLGLHQLNDPGPLGLYRWWVLDLAWPIGGGAILGLLISRVLGGLLLVRSRKGDLLARDELLYIGAIALAWGLARATQTSAFVAVFILGATLLEPLRMRQHPMPANASVAPLWERLHSFGARTERLAEAATVLAVGMALNSTTIQADELVFGLLLVVLVRPLSVLMVVRGGALGRNQKRLLAWFGIRGVGSLFYLAFSIEHGVQGHLAEVLTGTVLTAIAVSIVLHGISATPLMSRYQTRRARRRATKA